MSSSEAPAPIATIHSEAIPLITEPYVPQTLEVKNRSVMRALMSLNYERLRKFPAIATAVFRYNAMEVMSIRQNDPAWHRSRIQLRRGIGKVDSDTAQLDKEINSILEIIIKLSELPSAKHAEFIRYIALEPDYSDDVLAEAERTYTTLPPLKPDISLKTLLNAFNYLHHEFQFLKKLENNTITHEAQFTEIVGQLNYALNNELDTTKWKYRNGTGQPIKTDEWGYAELYHKLREIDETDKDFFGSFVIILMALSNDTEWAAIRKHVLSLSETSQAAVKGVGGGEVKKKVQKRKAKVIDIQPKVFETSDTQLFELFLNELFKAIKKSEPERYLEIFGQIYFKLVGLLEEQKLVGEEKLVDLRALNKHLQPQDLGNLDEKILANLITIEQEILRGFTQFDQVLEKVIHAYSLNDLGFTLNSQEISFELYYDLIRYQIFVNEQPKTTSDDTPPQVQEALAKYERPHLTRPKTEDDLAKLAELKPRERDKSVNLIQRVAKNIAVNRKSAFDRDVGNARGAISLLSHLKYFRYFNRFGKFIEQTFDLQTINASLEHLHIKLDSVPTTKKAALDLIKNKKLLLENPHEKQAFLEFIWIKIPTESQELIHDIFEEEITKRNGEGFLRQASEAV